MHSFIIDIGTGKSVTLDSLQTTATKTCEVIILKYCICTFSTRKDHIIGKLSVWFIKNKELEKAYKTQGGEAQGKRVVSLRGEFRLHCISLLFLCWKREKEKRKRRSG